MTESTQGFIPGGTLCAPNWSAVFGAEKPLILEVGFGRPHFLYDLASQFQTHHVIGIEWKKAWPVQANKRVRREGIDNLLAIHGNAWHLTECLFETAALDMLFLNFPDPWWKKKHRKRRIIQPAFVDIAARKLKPGGHFYVQTDVASLMEEILMHIEYDERFENKYGEGRLCPRKPVQAFSHREKKCIADGVPIFRADLVRV